MTCVTGMSAAIRLPRRATTDAAVQRGGFVPCEPSSGRPSRFSVPMAEICYSLGRIPTEIGRLAGSRPPRFHSLDRCQRFFARLRATCQIAHNLGISIHRVQPIEVVVLEWLEPESCRNQHGHLDTSERSTEIG